MGIIEGVIHAELEAFDCKAELYVNDIPIASIRQPTGWFQSIPVHEYLIPGMNRIELLVEPGPTPRVTRREWRKVPSQGARSVARLVRYSPGMYPEAANGELLAETTWHASRHGGTETFPQFRTNGVDLGHFHDRWSWQDAPPLVLNLALREEACLVLREVASAIQSASLGAFWSATELRISDAMRAYPALKEQVARSELIDFLNFYQKAAAPVLPLRTERHEFRLVADGRMLECIDDDWLPSLRLGNPEDSSPIPYPLFLSNIGGRLRTLR